MTQSPPLSQSSIKTVYLRGFISEITESYIQESIVSKRIEIEVAWPKQGRREALEQRLGTDPETGRQILSTCAQNLHYYVDVEEWNRCRNILRDRNGEAQLSSVPFLNSQVDMVHIGLAVRLVQLFIGAGKVQKPSSPNEGNYFHMAGNLVQVITRQVCSAVQHHDLIKSRGSRSLYDEDKISQLTQFTMHLFILVLNPICGVYPMLLPHTWRGFCEITSLLHKTDRIDENCLIPAINCLVTYLGEGTDNLINTLRKSGERDQIQISKQVKILIFFAARLATLLPILLHGKLNTSTSIISDSLGMITLLLKLRGMSLLVPTLSYMIGLTLNKDAVKFLVKQVTQLSLKAGQCLDEMILVAEGADMTARNSNNYLNTLITLKLCQDKNSSCFVKDSQNSIRVANLLSESALCLGKFQMLLSIVSKFVPSSQTMSGDMRPPKLPRIDAESALDVCEELLYRTLPACHVYISLAPCRLPRDEQEVEPLNLLSQAISNIVSCIIKCEKLKSEGSKTTRKTQIHHLLVRWLCPINNERSRLSDAPLHPFSQEIILAVVQMYIVRSTVGEQDNTNAATSKKFLSLLTKLLLDPRTITKHREIIGVLLYRLLSSSDKVRKNPSKHRLETLKTHVELALYRALKGYVVQKSDTAQDIEGGSKRRRCSIRMSRFETLKCWTYADLHAIAPLLEMLSFRDTFWREIDDRLKEQIFRSCSDVQHMQLVEKDKNWRGATYLVLILHTGSIMTGERISQQMTKEKMVEAVLTAFVKSCKSIDGSFTNQDICAILLRFLFVFFAKFRNPLSHQHSQLLSDGLRCSLHHPKNFKTNLHVAAIFSQITHVIGVDTQNHALLPIISSYFHSKLSSGNIGIVAVIMEAIEKFASTLPAKHRKILPSCIPPQSQGLLQCRLKGGTFSFSLGKACSIELHKQFEWGWIDSQTLIICTSVTSTFRIRKRYHPSLDILIENRSKIITVHSKNNSTVSAIIIIPPSEESQATENILNTAFNLGKAQLLGSLTKVALANHGFGCTLKIESDKIA